MPKTKEPQVFELDTLQVESLPELQGWREKQQAIVKENPFIACEDHKTYTEAKKNRTALVSARTSIEKQEKLIASKLSEFRKRVGQASKDLIEITQPHEEKQQEEVKRYEAEKEAERLEKERLEEERKTAIQAGINNFYSVWKKAISEVALEEVPGLKKEIVEQLNEQDEIDKQEFQADFDEKVVLLKDQLKERIQFLEEKEAARIESERLAKERAEFEAQKAKEEAARKEREAKERAAREAEQEKLRREREELEAEKKRIADNEAARQDAINRAEKAKEEADAKAKADAEEKERKAAEAKRLKALQPDKEKMLEYVNSFHSSEDYPKLKDPNAADVLETLVQSHKDWIAGAIDRINNLK